MEHSNKLIYFKLLGLFDIVFQLIISHYLWKTLLIIHISLLTYDIMGFLFYSTHREGKSKLHAPSKLDIDSS